MGKPVSFSIAEGDDIVLSFGELTMTVQPQLGGRITSFRLGQREVLTGPDVVANGDESLRNMYGSTFWTSPQAAWGWPPEAAVDRLAYSYAVSGSVEEQALTLLGGAGETTRYAVSKCFRRHHSRQCLNVEYRMLNRGASLPAAPWEISRVRKRGMVLFPSQSVPTGESTCLSEMRNGIAWLDIAKAPGGDSKLFQKGSEGWLAYVCDGLALIKTFDEIAEAEQAPGEAEIEIFISGGYDYVELEQQGRYAEQPAGAEGVWTVGWWLKAVPDELEITPGNDALVNWIRQVIAGGKS